MMLEGLLLLVTLITLGLGFRELKTLEKLQELQGLPEEEEQEMSYCTKKCELNSDCMPKQKCVNTGEKYISSKGHRHCVQS